MLTLRKDAFVGCTAFFVVMAYFYFPETRRKSLEEIAAAFGDKVVTLTDRDLAAEHVAVGDEKEAVDFVEEKEEVDNKV